MADIHRFTIHPDLIKHAAATGESIVVEYSSDGRYFVCRAQVGRTAGSAERTPHG